MNTLTSSATGAQLKIINYGSTNEYDKSLPHVGNRPGPPTADISYYTLNSNNLSYSASIIGSGVTMNNLIASSN